MLKKMVLFPRGRKAMAAVPVRKQFSKARADFFNSGNRVVNRLITPVHKKGEPLPTMVEIFRQPSKA
jgi:hypothetical protein